MLLCDVTITLVRQEKYENIFFLEQHIKWICLVVNQITVNNFTALFNSTPVGSGLRLIDGSGLHTFKEVCWGLMICP